MKFSKIFAVFFILSYIFLAVLITVPAQKEIPSLVMRELVLRNEVSLDLPKLVISTFRLGDTYYAYTGYYVDKKMASLGNDIYPLHISKLSEDLTTFSPAQSFLGAEHIRHHVTLKTPWGDGVLFADHGVDFSEYNRGGRIKLLIRNIHTDQLEDHSDKLNLRKGFYFNVVAPKRDGEEYNDILIMPYNTEISFPVYFQMIDGKYVDKSHLLPKEWREQKHCSMTGISYDLDSDGTDEVVLGGCDQKEIYNPALKDRIIKYQDSGWVYLEDKILPLRTGSLGWGTVYFHKDDLNNDGSEDIVALTHDEGFHLGLPQIMFFSEKDKVFVNQEVRNWPSSLLNPSHHYLHNVVSFDINNDGRKDLVGHLRYLGDLHPVLPNVFILINNGDSFKFEMLKDYIDLGNEFLIGLEVVENELFLFTLSEKVLSIKYEKEE